MLRKLSIGFAITLSLAACASANKRLEQGQDLQRAGRPAEAAERYIQALKKDGRLDSARAGLRTAGGAAIDLWLRTAADPATQPDAAAEQYLAIDDLSRRALEVGIFLPPPADYETRKRAAFDRAIADDISDASLLANQRQFADALNRLSRASSAYRPNPIQQAALGNAGAEVAIAWGRADTAAGQFRAAYGRVTPIVSAPVRAALADDARALQAAALARGTKRVAIVPVSATINARANLPEDALPALADALDAEPWINPPAFVNTLARTDVERELRRYGGYSRRTLSNAEGVRLARALGADFAVVSEIDSVRREDTNVRTTRRPVRTRSGVDTAYIVEEGTARLFANATFVIIDREGQGPFEYRAVNASATGRFTRVRYNGDYRTLDLRLGERELFTRDAGEGDLVRSLVGALSPRLGEGVFGEVVRRIP